MEDLDTDGILSSAEDAVRRAIDRGAEGAEAYLASGTSVGVEVESDVVSYTSGDSERGTGLRVVRGGRLGFAYTSDPSRLEEAIDRALSLSRLSPARGYTLPPPGGAYDRVDGTLDPRLLDMGPGEAVEMAGAMVDAARAVHDGVVVAGGGVSFGHGTVAIANSSGVSVVRRGTSISASAYVVLRDRTVSTGHEWASSRSRDVDPVWVGTEAANLALEAQGAEALETEGEMTLVFRPSALSELLEHTLVPSVIGDAAQRGESAWSGMDGQEVTARELTVADDPRLPGGLNSSVADDEGVRTRRNVLVEDGVLEGFLYDSFTAQEYGVETTGSAVRGGSSAWKGQPEPAASNVVLELPTRDSLDDLVAQVDRGLLVHDVMGAHTANRSSLDFSVNTTMPFEIRRGELVGVRAPVMLGGNVGELLRRVVGAGGMPRQCPGTLTGATLVLPWVAADGMTVTP